MKPSPFTFTTTRQTIRGVYRLPFQKPGRAARTCKGCSIFIGFHPRQKWCSDKCRMAFNRRKTDG